MGNAVGECDGSQIRSSENEIAYAVDMVGDAFRDDSVVHDKVARGPGVASPIVTSWGVGVGDLDRLGDSAYDVEIDGIYYNLDKNSRTAEVTYKYSDGKSSYTGNVIIPHKIVYEGTTYDIKHIGMGAFNSCSSPLSVTIPNSVISIGEQAFALCKGLSSLTIPNSIASIWKSAFSGCI